MRTVLCVRIGVNYDCARLCDSYGKRSEGNTAKKNLTFLRVHNICFVSIRSLSRLFVHNLCERIIKSEIKYTRDCIGQRLAEFQFHPDITTIRK